VALQHLVDPRTLQGDRQLDVTERATEQSKDGPKQTQNQNEDVRGLTYYNLILFKCVNDTDNSYDYMTSIKDG
jgi:hypothetical protein